ncbi:Polysaccharide pyruvyl transferase family protein WcaK [Pseudobutyrivibrio sp. UC1225]|uniref:polysaccharide pyruvyl transferase family protein n=1 Tax=Pseudobutyrivibrio sp. UC1225 TaxID=1798185 RepID=UPI0008ED71F7|nr:polysaccharide pyruvyl transferase family protein [Pseudobutyrivibrio sp. UC1225]SFO26556.1 Polysaccharide pyruvyl transferase family protein WcaK [Pseudobutyrivibrio sp. UC1225]
MGNIVLAGLFFDTNLGDQAIAESTEYLVKDSLKNQDVVLDKIDLYGRKKIENNSNILVDKVRFHIRRMKYGPNEYELARLKKLCEKYISKDTKCIIFTGGGLIKYKYQLIFSRAIEMITDFANKNNVPVMFCGVGIEGYDENDVECQRLKKVINSDCVKVITTRDDIECLSNNYVDSATIKTALVADPACVISGLHKIKNTKNKRVGLGVVRGRLFVDNGINADEDALIALYSSLYQEIKSRGYEPIIYTNGLGADQIFAEKLKKHLEITLNVNAEVANRPTTVEELCKIICSFDALICARLHSSIIAYSYGVPSIGIVWNEKQRMFGKIIGYPERFIDYSNSTVSDTMKAFEKAVDEEYRNIDKDNFVKTTRNEIEAFLQKYV